jgi:hypothetical protein
VLLWGLAGALPPAFASDGGSPSTWRGTGKQTSQAPDSKQQTTASQAAEPTAMHSQPATASQNKVAAPFDEGEKLQWRPQRPSKQAAEAAPSRTIQLVQAVAEQADPFEELIPRRPLEAARAPAIEISSIQQPSVTVNSKHR